MRKNCEICKIFCCILEDYKVKMYDRHMLAIWLYDFETPMEMETKVYCMECLFTLADNRLISNLGTPEVSRRCLYCVAPTAPGEAIRFEYYDNGSIPNVRHVCVECYVENVDNIKS